MQENATLEAGTGPRRRRPLVLPLAIFAAMAALFGLALRGGDPSRLPSALIGKLAPAINLSALEGLTDSGKPVPGFDLTDLTYHRAVDQATVRVAFDRPEVRNAFRPHTVDELFRVLEKMLVLLILMMVM